MNDLLKILNLFGQNSDKKEEPQKQEIPKEILDQYPYGDFPIKYTRAGQEILRKESESRFSYTEQSPKNTEEEHQENNLNIAELLPLLQLMSGKKEPQDMFKVLSKILFKDNKDLQSIFNLIPNNIKSQELENTNPFPDTNKVKISSLKRIN